MNTPLEWGERRAGSEANRFNGFRGGGETVETVLACGTFAFTPLKWGVTEKSEEKGRI
jgi:hypothetical protein